MNALDDTDNAAAGAAVRFATHELRENGVAVHRVAHVVSWNKKIAIETGDGFFGNYESVAIAMGDETSAD